jgi:ribokinase
METSKTGRIVVLGSASHDIFLKVDRMPHVGETLSCSGVERSFGGKGANQANTCGKLGA